MIVRFGGPVGVEEFVEGVEAVEVVAARVGESAVVAGGWWDGSVAVHPDGYGGPVAKDMGLAEHEGVFNVDA